MKKSKFIQFAIQSQPASVFQQSPRMGCIRLDLTILGGEILADLVAVYDWIEKTYFLM
jgi:hypothetical protein